MRFRSKWTMWGHFRYLHFKSFPMVLWGPKLVFFCLFNWSFEYFELSHECNPQNGNAFGNHWAQFLTLCPTCENVFHYLTQFFGLMCLCTPQLIANSMLSENVFHYLTHFFGLMCFCTPQLIVNLMLRLWYLACI